jgi:microcystin-dependent protein
MRTSGQEAGGYGLIGGAAAFQNRVIVSGNPYDYPGYHGASASHYHSFSTSSSYANISLQYNGGNASHNNMQPSIALNYIIKT